MLYGTILESARDGIMFFYGSVVWKRIVHDLGLPSETFEPFAQYNDAILFNISDCLADILHEGTQDTYLQFFGEDFFRYFKTLGYEKLFRVAGRTLREFLFVIDQLHDSRRFTFPQMQSPIFHVTEEDYTGVTLEYKSVRRGLTHFAMGTLLGAAKTLFKEMNTRVYVRNNLSTDEYTHIVFWVQFDNRTYRIQQLYNFPCLPNVTGPTFLKVFPFSILMDSSLRIHHMGSNIRKVFPSDTILTGQPLNDVFRLIRPSIHVEWDKILSYSRHIVFLMENRLPLHVGLSGRIQLKGQMKFIESKSMLWFLCHPVLESAEDMVSAGLSLTDLNLFDGTSELLITSMHRTKEIGDAMEKGRSCMLQLDDVRTQLVQCRKRNRTILDAIMPKHIAAMIQSGIPTYSLCEFYPLVTIMFAYIMDFKMSISYLKPAKIIEVLNETINRFDNITEKFDVFKVKTKLDTTYMFVADIHDRSNIISKDLEPSLVDVTATEDNEKNGRNSSELNSTEIIAYLAFELIQAGKDLINPITRQPFGIKIGFHAGAAIGGIIGDQKLQYCLFGDTITIARQIMTTGANGRIHISQAAYQQLLADDRFTIERHDRVDGTNDKNTDATYWLTGINKTTSTNVINKTTKLVQCPFSGQLL